MKTDNIFWLGHDSFRISGSRTVYIDPWEVRGPVADIILVTHDHHDHCDPDTIKALSGPKTQVAGSYSAVAKMREAGVAARLTAVEPGDEIEIMGVRVKAVPSYNIDKDFHPRSKNYVGYVVIMDGQSVYHAGDTDFIPEMRDLRVQVALLPVGGTYTMTAGEAVEATLAIRPEVVIPMHYGKVVGDAGMAEEFAAGLRGRVPVVIKEQI